MSQFISLTEAVTMTTYYRQEKENILDPLYQNQNILCRSETFDLATVNAVIAQMGCTKLRVYYGMDESKKVHAILVGVNEKDEDLLPALTMSTGTDDPPIGENAQRCPVNCPPVSPLNP